MKYYVISISNYGIISNYMLEDLKKLQNVEFLYETYIKATSSNRYIRKIDSIIKNFYYKLIYKKKMINKIIKDNTCSNKEKTVLFTNEALQKIELANLEQLRNAGIKVVMLLIDPMSANYPSVSVAKSLMEQFKFDEIITFDPIDAKEYGFKYQNTLYSTFKFDTKASNEKDLFYLGCVKDRFDMMLNLKNMIKDNQVNVDVKLLGLNQNQINQIGEEYSMNTYLPYDEMLRRMQSSKCILDITQKGQSGVTLRYYEAIVYNKKLLTNNENIKKLPFYDERYMKFYTNLGDIDWDWVKNDDMPNYKYNNEYSPIHIIETLEVNDEKEIS
ncbi:hypothetical protein [Lachnobacterium bovis]|uniref:Uncharacterized protein n=1 Tax=Lachnobacterium bovis TaxID=140626 RepID=A0A1H9NZ63_9FIRM|nr:hypothetical protein [Lachnobacterium bovis]SER41232.1 hypothetical protein SAMN02910429_00018 [Lachnobacterium bovis]